jgi:poly(hydroxyalkanoate) depolymerase family esterase
MSAQFLDGEHTNAEGTMKYKLYVPANPTGARLPLLVMLHGCTQNPEDIAAGSRMNTLADTHGFLVAYPAQRPGANGRNCWNWFSEKDQIRNQGEPSLIAGIALDVAGGYAVDDARIYVAGMSSGAAMAVILGATYPDIFCAVGAHSGLAYGAAYDLSTAFAAMWGTTTLFGLPMLFSMRSKHWSTARAAIPTIVFHGDADSTVGAHNGVEIVNQAVTLALEAHGPLEKTEQRYRMDNGREFTATTYRNTAKRPIVEHRVLHGTGHGWSGGSAEGSHTDPTGLDASREMVQFFLAQSSLRDTERHAA